jgi:acyl carrier protein phosphodiesterase
MRRGRPPGEEPNRLFSLNLRQSNYDWLERKAATSEQSISEIINGMVKAAKQFEDDSDLRMFQEDYDRLMKEQN